MSSGALNSKNSKAAEWPTPAESKAKEDMPRLDEAFEKIEAPADMLSKSKDKKLRTGYTMVDMKNVPKADALDRDGKPFGVAAEKDAEGKAADEISDGFVEVQDDLTEVDDEDGKRAKRI
ncbi:hypothetical protein CERZMDRAFT_119243 [Cercospora zeae-maydis SCOH1-5]|uniref:Uncharacterized protein n=1 Tax=Cercospora zeae-maydis SCOH1-5 TaxID=717836 RepID=A0A6A6F2K0_9PEZI|nr:hypothetical protein CERZMDRAFT_119243 [Cercospora zeae-maydis SCOH1-5]